MVVHALERQVFPVLQRLDSSTKYHITVVSPNDYFFFKIASPRALVDPKNMPADKIFKSVPAAFKQYGAGVTFTQGKAVGLHAQSRIVSVELASGATSELKYDSLVIATGTTSASPLWTLHGSQEISINALKETHELLPKIKTVLIGGAGPVGVETAGEIAHFFPNIKITLVAATSILDGIGKVGEKAKPVLKSKKVDVLLNTRVQGATKTGSGYKVDLSDGSSRDVDLFIDARGAAKVNSEFLPRPWLDAKGRVVTKDSYFRVKGDGQDDVSGVYALGDVVSGVENTAIWLDAEIPVVASSIGVDIAKRLGHEPEKSGGPCSWLPGFGSGKGVSQKEFKPMKNTIMVPIGPTGGVGQLMGYSTPSFMVKKGKAEKFLVEMIEPMETGSKYAKA